MKLDPETLRKLARLTLDAKPPALTCEEWTHMVGEYVEGARAGDDLSSERMRAVLEHARDCPPCMQELEALRELLGDGAE